MCTCVFSYIYYIIIIEAKPNRTKNETPKSKSLYSEELEYSIVYIVSHRIRGWQ